MSLSLYKKKRSFKKTPEPRGGKPRSKGLLFVIQKHDASHLHYDFRLEMRGVLKSWAVPKGPSLDPSVKRLAMMVEDHPYDYRNFEGTIPKGEYGGGTVIIWDEGSYEPAGGKFGSKAEMEKDLLSQLKKGKLKIVLSGTRLKGLFALVKASSRGENAWLLMKLEDEFVSRTDILKKAASVRSGRTLKQVEKEAATIANGGSKKGGRKKAPAKKKAGPLGKKAPFPANLQPMFASLAEKPVEEEGWVYEIKWDGYRALAYLKNGKVILRSRNNKSFTERFFPVVKALEDLNLNAVLDGEIVVLGKKGESRFGDLQNWRSDDDGLLAYFVFDLLWLDGYSLMHLPLFERRSQLEKILRPNTIIRLSEAINTSGDDFLEAARKMDLEGIMAKKADSDYKPGYRSREWLKIKTNKRQEVVIGGYTINEGTGKPFSALLAGVYDKKGRLVYTGKIGTGFSIKTQKEMLRQFKPLLAKKNPFYQLPDLGRPGRFYHNPPRAEMKFLKPVLVCEVSFTEITSDGLMRHPSFVGMRDDKKARDVILEKPVAR